MNAIGGRTQSMHLLKIALVSCYVLLCCRESLSCSDCIAGDQSAIQYLVKYGYLEKPAEGSTFAVTSACVIKAVKNFQLLAGLEQTGTLNNVTIELMNRPRCGNQDFRKDQGIREHFTIQGSKWKSHVLSYRISKYPPRIGRKEDVRQVIRQAFKVWSDVSDLRFVERYTGRVNIDIRFEPKNHCKKCDDAFDGPGSVLAHAFYPDSGGKIHFDSEVNWTIASPLGTNLLQVAIHEIGHSLGLGHAHERNAAMSPFYDCTRQKTTFRPDTVDVAAIQMLYGPASLTDICKDTKIQAATMLHNGEIYVFKGEFYWRVLQNRIAEGYPRRITEDWHGIPGNLDAALTLPNGKTLFFKGDQFWCFHNRTYDYGSPRKIRDSFPKVPDNLDAAVIWSGNNKIYFFKGNVYWLFDQDVDKQEAVKGYYPMAISQYWSGIPDNLDAAFLAHDNETYFFKDDKYYRFHDEKVEAAEPPYPRLTSKYWFGCKSTDQHFTECPERQFEVVKIANP